MDLTESAVLRRCRDESCSIGRVTLDWGQHEPFAL